MTEIPAFDDLKRGHVVLAPDPFKPDEDDYRHRSAPRDSSLVPHAVASLGPALMTDCVCRIRSLPLDRAVERLEAYLQG